MMKKSIIRPETGSSNQLTENAIKEHKEKSGRSNPCSNHSTDND